MHLDITVPRDGRDIIEEKEKWKTVMRRPRNAGICDYGKLDHDWEINHKRGCEPRGTWKRSQRINVSPKSTKNVGVRRGRRRMTAPGRTSPRTLSIRPSFRKEWPWLPSQIRVARDRCHYLRELRSGKGLCSSAATRGSCRGLGAGLLAWIVEQAQIFGLPILSGRSWT